MACLDSVLYLVASAAPISCIYAVLNVPVIDIYSFPVNFKKASSDDNELITEKNKYSFKRIYLWNALFENKHIRYDILYIKINKEASLLPATPSHNTLLNAYSKNIHDNTIHSLFLSYDEDKNKSITRINSNVIPNTIVTNFHINK
jgi:hypothetical protein